MPLSSISVNSFVQELSRFSFNEYASHLTWYLSIRDPDLLQDFQAFAIVKRSYISLFYFSIFFTFIAVPVETIVTISIGYSDENFFCFLFSLCYTLLLVVISGLSWCFYYMKQYPKLHNYDNIISILFIITFTGIVTMRLFRYIIFPNTLGPVVNILIGHDPDLQDHALLWDSGCLLVIPPIGFIIILKETKFYVIILAYMVILGVISFVNLYYFPLTFGLLVMWSGMGAVLLIELHLQNIKSFFLKRKLVETLLEIEKMNEHNQAYEMRHMIANVAHDLKTPLASFTSGLELIEHVLLDMEECNHTQTLTSELTHEKCLMISQSLEDIRNTNSFMLMTINRCIDYTKASKGMKLVPRYETIDLMETLRLPLNCMRNIQHRIEISLKPIPEEICSHVITDKQWLQENILCLLSNAVKYSSSGEVTIQLSLEKSDSESDLDGKVIMNKEMKLKLVVPQHQTYRSSIKVVPQTISQSSQSLAVDEIDKKEQEVFRSSDKSYHNVIPLHKTHKSLLSTGSDNFIGFSDKPTISSPDTSPLTKGRKTFLSNNTNTVNLTGASENSIKRNLNKSPSYQARKSLLCLQAESFPVLRFEVEDTGIGMSDEAMKSLFNAFKQTQRLAGGTGLGLYSLAKRIEALNGKYGVSQRRDGKQGSLFWFTIPYKPDEVTSQMNRKEMTTTHQSIRLGNIHRRTSISVSINPRTYNASTSSTGSNNRLNVTSNVEPTNVFEGKLDILIVDDSPAILKMTSLMLRRQGHEVHQAENGALAVKMVEERWKETGKVFDLVLMDLQMPVMDGLEATRRIRKTEKEEFDSLQIYDIQSSNQLENFRDPKTNSIIKPRQVIVGCSANSDAETTEEAMQAGVDGFMPKPFTMDTFNHISKQYVGKYKEMTLDQLYSFSI